MKFVSAYRQLQPSEREFVDGFLRALDIENAKRFERLTVTLERATAALDLDTLDSRARDQFAKALVQAAIRERVDAISAERDISPEWLLRIHADIANGNIRRFMPTTGEDGHPKFDATDCTDADWRAVQAVEIVEKYGRGGTERTTKIKMHSVQTSLIEMAKYMPTLERMQEYRNLPPEMARISASASVETLAEQYAEFIGG